MTTQEPFHSSAKFQVLFFGSTVTNANNTFGEHGNFFNKHYYHIPGIVLSTEDKLCIFMDVHENINKIMEFQHSTLLVRQLRSARHPIHLDRRQHVKLKKKML